MMLANRVVIQIQDLLREGRLSQRAIAVVLEVSRTTVNKIANGHPRRQRTTQQEDLDRWGRPYERCPGCGGKVQMPCLACQIRGDLPASDEFVELMAEERLLDAGLESALDDAANEQAIAVDVAEFYAEQKALRESAYARDLAEAAARRRAEYEDPELADAWDE